jgi:hypothetical protein
MMAARKSTIVLCEDEAHWLFIYRWLRSRGVHPNEIRCVPLPAGKGAATRYVLSRYPDEVREYRSRANQVAERRLIVAIDADTSTVPERLASLAAALEGEELPARANLDRICLLVPKRNVETWIHFLHQQPVNETDDCSAFYVGDARAPACKVAGAAFGAWLRADEPAQGSPPSIVAARQEVQRVVS